MDEFRVVAFLGCDIIIMEDDSFFIYDFYVNFIWRS